MKGLFQRSSLSAIRLCLPVALASLEPVAAHACSCAAGLMYSLPAQGAVNAPLNPTITLGFLGAPPTSFALIDTAGQTRALEAYHTLTGDLHQLSLTLPSGTVLEAATTYRVEGDGAQLLQFTTGEAVDTGRPALERIVSLEGGYDDGYSNGGYSSCGESVQMRVAYEGGTDDLTPASDLLYRVYMSTDGQPELSGYSVVLPGSWSLGSSLCLTTYAGLQPGDTFTIQASVIDAAGLESALSAPVSAVVENDPDTPAGGGLGCNQAGSRDGLGTGAVAGLVLGAGWMARRRFCARS